MKVILLAILFIITIGQASATENNRLNPFESDGCSVVPDSEPFSGNDWLNCCIPHDINYWKGGTEEEKNKTDMAFKVCLEKNKMGAWLSRIFYYGVSVGGTPAVKTSWRWGYGWEKSRGFSALSKAELEEVNEYKNLLTLPVFIRSPEVVDFLTDSLTTKNNCKQDMLKTIKQSMQFELAPTLLKIHRIEGKGGDRYQIFSPECKGGYMVFDFKPTLAADVCLLSDYFYYQVERIKSFQVYGTCENFIRK